VGVFLVLLLLALAGVLFALSNSSDSAKKETDNASNKEAKADKKDSSGNSGGSSGKKNNGAKKSESDKSGSNVKLGDKPEAVKGIYMSAYTVGGNLDAYLDFTDSTEINAMVIDVKDVTGEVMYPSEVPLANEIGATREVLPDLETLTKQLDDRGVYSIARIAVFEDDILPRERPDLAPTDSSTGEPWLTNAGQAWSDGYNNEVW